MRLRLLSRRNRAELKGGHVAYGKVIEHKPHKPGTHPGFSTARYYDPTIGRFIQADIAVQDPYDPQTLNRYSYCRNNPIIYTDPSGHFFARGHGDTSEWRVMVGGFHLKSAVKLSSLWGPPQLKNY